METYWENVYKLNSFTEKCSAISMDWRAEFFAQMRVAEAPRVDHGWWRLWGDVFCVSQTAGDETAPQETQF